MKIGILTWTYSNYGTLLQAYALQSFLKENGFLVNLIKYTPKNQNVIKYNRYDIDNIYVKLQNRIKRRVEKRNIDLIDVFSKQALEKREDLFQLFIESKLPLTEEYRIEELENLNNKYDAFIVGSDQIWSPKFLDGTFFLNFLSDNSKKISYAPSFGVEKLDIRVEKIIKPWLESFDSISVRENTGSNIVSGILNKKVPVVLDPTLLYTGDEWNNIIKNRKRKISTKNKYILCYFLSEKEYYWNIVKKVKEKLGYEVVVIPNKPLDFNNKYEKQIEVDPFNFVELIRDAEYILTDSFHGTIFSINYNKSFLTLARFDDIKKESENSRLKSILEYLDLEDRFIKNEENIKENLKISKRKYKEVQNKLDKRRNQSKEYLLRSLE